MTDDRRPNRPAPFGPHELDGVPGLRPDELAAEARLARELEATAVHGTVAPSAGFSDRVMAAIADEPSPAPVVAAGRAIRHGALGGFLASIHDAFRITFGGGFPMAARTQALALVLLVAVVAGGSGFAAAGALGLFRDRGQPSLPPTLVSPITRRVADAVTHRHAVGDRVAVAVPVAERDTGGRDALAGRDRGCPGDPGAGRDRGRDRRQQRAGSGSGSDDGDELGPGRRRLRVRLGQLRLGRRAATASIRSDTPPSGRHARARGHPHPDDD